VAACAAACVDTLSAACVACLGPLYATCVQCYSSSMDHEKIGNDTIYMMQAYYKAIMPRKPNI
jgi:hypothetical protein